MINIKKLRGALSGNGFLINWFRSSDPPPTYPIAKQSPETQISPSDPSDTRFILLSTIYILTLSNTEPKLDRPITNFDSKSLNESNISKAISPVVSIEPVQLHKVTPLLKMSKNHFACIYI